MILGMLVMCVWCTSILITNKTLKNILVSPKDKDPMKKKIGIICWFRCQEPKCDDEYIAELARTFAERFKEHLKASWTLHGHQATTVHLTTMDNFSIVDSKRRALPEQSMSPYL